MKSPKAIVITWVTLCLFSLPVFAGILQPGDIVFADGGLDLVIRLDPNTLATNHIARIDFDEPGSLVTPHDMKLVPLSFCSTCHRVPVAIPASKGPAR